MLLGESLNINTHYDFNDLHLILLLLCLLMECLAIFDAPWVVQLAVSW
jgi:hypothetical protein